ncbi:MAG: YggS family pyridoxal phosphate-dependent enzyme [bacterium]
MTLICENLRIIGEQIREAEQRYGRKPNSVTLLAVSKRHSLSAIQQAITCGQTAFGENYAQELQHKQTALLTQSPSLAWHFIGPLQSNKTKVLADCAAWVHSVDRLKIAQRLQEQRPKGLPPLNICLQINTSEEASKSGVLPQDALALASAVSEFPQLRLRGLMSIPARVDDFAAQRQQFAALRRVQAQLIQAGFALDTLSMGMSHDYAAAIAEGATIIRVGTAIFGART